MQDENNTVIEVKNLAKNYGGLKAVDGVSFAIGRGEIVGLLGPNGAGKSTTINMILGLLTPTSGSIRIFGRDLAAHRSEILSRVNFAAVYAQLPSNLTVFQNLNLFSLLYGVPNRGQRIEDLLKEFVLQKLRGVRSGFLSSGEQSRLNLAKALVNRPGLLLLDEPTASLDPSASRTVRDNMKNYARRNGAAILWTSHDMNEITEVCGHVLFISHGKILLEGDPRELPAEHGRKNLEDLFIAVAREPLSVIHR